jgi:hypothetical protein
MPCPRPNAPGSDDRLRAGPPREKKLGRLQEVRPGEAVGQDATALTAYRVRVEHDGSATAMSACADESYARSFLPAPSASKMQSRKATGRPQTLTVRAGRETIQKNPSAGGRVCWSAVRRKQERFGGKRTALGWTLKRTLPSSRGKVRRGVLVHQIAYGHATGLPSRKSGLTDSFSISYWSAPGPRPCRRACPVCHHDPWKWSRALACSLPGRSSCKVTGTASVSGALPPAQCLSRRPPGSVPFETAPRAHASLSAQAHACGSEWRSRCTVSHRSRTPARHSEPRA